jgi:hypothetical protein
MCCGLITSAGLHLPGNGQQPILTIGSDLRFLRDPALMTSANGHYSLAQALTYGLRGVP